MSQSSRFRPDIQGLRGLAVLLVIAYHAKIGFDSGFIGVDMFFVISGFVIGHSLLREFQTKGKISIRDFYIRRFRRLAPAQALVTLFTLGASFAILSPLGPLQTAGLNAAATSLNIANISIELTSGDYFDPPAESNPFLHMWSLSVEEQFYLVFPVALALTLSTRDTRRPLFFTLWTLTLAALVSITLATGGPFFSDSVTQSAIIGFYSPITRVWEFLIGAIAAALIFSRRNRLNQKFGDLLGICGTGSIVWSLAAISDETQWPGFTSLIPTLGVLALLLAGSNSQSIWRKSLSLPPLRWIGDRSYSLYLWHWPIIVLSTRLFPDVQGLSLAAALISLVPAWLSYKYVEEPIRRGAVFRLSGLKTQISIFTLIPLIISLGIVFASNAVWAQKIEAYSARPPGYVLGCHASSNQQSLFEVCEFGDYQHEEKEPSVLLLGDSHAAQYSAGLIAAAETMGVNLYVSTASNCPFLVDLQFSDSCTAWNKFAHQRQREILPTVVILAMSDQYWVDSEWKIVNSAEQSVIEAERKIESLEKSLNLTLGQLVRQGSIPVVIQDGPSWHGDYQWSLDECSAIQIEIGCSESMPLSVLESERDDIWNVQESTAAKNGAVYANFLEQACPDMICATQLNSNWVFRDSHHYSNLFSLSLHDRWVNILEPLFHKQ